MTKMTRTLATLSIAAMMGVWILGTGSAQAEAEHQGQVTVTDEIFEVDDGGDGTVDFFQTTTVVYDANGNELSSHTRAHCDNGVGNGADCLPGSAAVNNDDVGGVPGNPGARSRITYETFEVDDGGDGTVDFLETTTVVYDANGNELSRSHTRAKCDNGVGNGPDCRPGRARYNNDDVGGVPGNPGAEGGGAAGTEY